MKRIVMLAIAVCFLLCGCTSWMDGSYVSVTPHQEKSAISGQEMVSVASYLELRTALASLVSNGTENAKIGVEAMDSAKVDSNMAMAIRYVVSSNPIGAYAVEDIRYEQGTSGGIPAVAVEITYNHDRAEIRGIKQVGGIDEAQQVIFDALDACETGVVMLVDKYSKTDFVQQIQDYADQHPETVMEIPSVTVNIYPDSGISRVVELKFTYQTSRESLRSMQSRVQAMFASAKLYVSGDTSDYEKYTHLASFLTSRYSQTETSITPSYSLMCYGVGDSKAHAVCFSALCHQVGLECQIVSGTRSGEPWFWNIICDEGVYYHVDLIPQGQPSSFLELSDSDMEGYVWDYSAYPACGAAEEASVPETQDMPETVEIPPKETAEPSVSEPPSGGEAENPVSEPTTQPPTEPESGTEAPTEAPTEASPLPTGGEVSEDTA